ncbi:MAG: hypothetical protein ABS913_01465 [Desemzia incerta]|uniref:hypothetical protein n=1 Tax=Desemzia incerta TaxID=82801 RepID=UPI0033156415
MEDEYDILACPINCFLDTGDYINKFNCGIDSINDFFSNKAMELDAINQARTTIFFDKKNKKIVGFYTITTASLIIEDKDNQIPKEIPVVNLSFLARDLFYKGKGFGNFMINELYYSLTIISFSLGFSLLTTTALNSATDFYKSVGFSPVSVDPDKVEYWVEEFQMYINYENMVQLAEYRPPLVDNVKS